VPPVPKHIFYCGRETFDSFEESLPPSLRFVLTEDRLKALNIASSIQAHLLIPLKNVGIEEWPLLVAVKQQV